jgi:hypothetical protein
MYLFFLRGLRGSILGKLGILVTLGIFSFPPVSRFACSTNITNLTNVTNSTEFTPVFIFS